MHGKIEILASSAARHSLAWRTECERTEKHVLCSCAFHESQQSQKILFCLKIQVINNEISTPSHTATVFLRFCTHRGFIFHFYFGPNRFSQICVTNLVHSAVSSLVSRFVWQASCRQSQLSSIIGMNNRNRGFSSSTIRQRN